MAFKLKTIMEVDFFYSFKIPDKLIGVGLFQSACVAKSDLRRVDTMGAGWQKEGGDLCRES